MTKNSFIQSKASAIESRRKDTAEYLMRAGAQRFLPYVIVALIATEAFTDSLTPRGYADWMLYLVPILLTSWLSARWTIRVTAAVTALTIIGFFFFPPIGTATWPRVFVSLINRSVGICVFWTAALLIHLRRRALDDARAANDTLRKKAQELIDAKRFKTEFLADASHELRAPLAIIKSHIDLALGERSKHLTDPYDALQGISAEVSHISTLITDLILLTRVPSAIDRRLDETNVDLRRLVNDIVEKYMPLATARHIKISVEAVDETCRGDHKQLTRLFSNLIVNAINYSRESGNISVRIYDDHDFIVIAVEDDGIGIPESDLPHIFERFYRVEKGRSRSKGGVGLGLAICKWVAEAHGGTINVVSTLNKGSVFTVRLPRG